jgi:hypothetical protein
MRRLSVENSQAADNTANIPSTPVNRANSSLLEKQPSAISCRSSVPSRSSTLVWQETPNWSGTKTEN